MINIQTPGRIEPQLQRVISAVQLSLQHINTAPQIHVVTAGGFSKKISCYLKQRRVCYFSYFNNICQLELRRLFTRALANPNGPAQDNL